MKEPLKYFLERKTLFGKIARFQRDRQLLKKYRTWEKKGAVPPMPNYGKQQVVIEYINSYSPDIFIETGTYKGKMVYAVIPFVKEIYSIELDEVLFRNAEKKFVGYPNIHILQGQSGQILPEVLKDIDQPCLFWLDAHYSGGSTAKGDLDTPIIQEMECILNHKRANDHIILIDDGRCFIGDNGYPSLQYLKKFILSKKPDWFFNVNRDIIITHSGKKTVFV